jgi:hypothetical protein
MLAAIRAGMDPVLAATQTRSIHSELAAAEATIRRWQQTHRQPGDLNEQAVREVLGEAEGLVELLADASRKDRAELYRALGVSLRYHKEAATRSGGRI